LELSVATAAGLFAYDPRHHRLVRRTVDDLRRAMQWAALAEEAIGDSPAVFVIAADGARLPSGADRRVR
jgi:hypothetical protein